MLVLMLHNSQWEEAAAAVRAEEKREGLDNAYIVSFIAPSVEEGEEINGGELPTKALLNAVSDLCQTRYVTDCRNDGRLFILVNVKNNELKPFFLLSPSFLVRFLFEVNPCTSMHSPPTRFVLPLRNVSPFG